MIVYCLKTCDAVDAKTQASRGSFAANREAVGISIQYARNAIDTSPPRSQATSESPEKITEIN